MEVHATRCWAKEMNKQGWTIRLCTTVKNEGEFPDCICKMGEQRLGVEVTEFTVGEIDRKKYVEGTEAGRSDYSLAPGVEWDDQTRNRVENRRRLSTPVPNTAVWPFDDFQMKLREIVRKKEKTAQKHRGDGTLAAVDILVLLIVTDEQNLWRGKLRDYLSRIKLPKSDCFCGTYVMMSPEPNSDVGNEHFPVFQVCMS